MPARSRAAVQPRAPGDGQGPGGQGPPGRDERIAALNAVVAEYARAVSASVALLGPVIETTQTAGREAEAHPELPMGPAMAGNMREALQTLERVYEVLRRVASPSGPIG